MGKTPEWWSYLMEQSISLQIPVVVFREGFEPDSLALMAAALLILICSMQHVLNPFTNMGELRVQSAKPSSSAPTPELMENHLSLKVCVETCHWRQRTDKINQTHIDCSLAR